MIVDHESAKALEKHHRDELRAMPERDALLAADRLLAMAAAAAYPADKETPVGLIERQRILYRIGK